MAKTMVEKILSKRLGRDVSASDFVIIPVDLVFSHDGTMPLAIQQMEALGREKVFDATKVIGVCDHASPPPSEAVSNIHAKMREFATKNNIRFYENGEGICHQIVLERYAAPYKIIIGADSHSTTHGALASFATGMGSTDVAAIMAYGRTWIKVPESLKVTITGDLDEHVHSKDIFLHLIGEIGEEGASYKSIEFLGDTVDRMSVEARATMTNMAIEAGAKCGICKADERVREFLRNYGREEEYKSLEPDKDASYKDEITIEAPKVEPMIACPHRVSNVKSVTECEGLEVDVVCIGTCTNGRIEDLRAAAKVLRSKKVAPSTRLIVCPASRRVFIQAIKEGLIEIFLSAGASVLPPSCSFCIGRTVALGDGEVALSTQNRNFKGRMGNNKAYIYLCSPETAAASALKGKISDPRYVNG
ncbi:MAG: 3-isopropylmalate dehydratase large subunit [Candidatus Methanospirareceae archaeon]